MQAMPLDIPSLQLPVKIPLVGIIIGKNPINMLACSISGKLSLHSPLSRSPSSLCVMTLNIFLILQKRTSPYSAVSDPSLASPPVPLFPSIPLRLETPEEADFLASVAQQLEA